jgi:hypothetical protein
MVNCGVALRIREDDLNASDKGKATPRSDGGSRNTCLHQFSLAWVVRDAAEKYIEEKWPPFAKERLSM